MPLLYIKTLLTSHILMSMPEVCIALSVYKRISIGWATTKFCVTGW